MIVGLERGGNGGTEVRGRSGRGRRAALGCLLVSILR